MVFNHHSPDGPLGLCSFSLLQMNFLVYSSLPISLGYIPEVELVYQKSMHFILLF